MSSQTSSFPGLCFHHTPPALLATNPNRYLWNGLYNPQFFELENLCQACQVWKSDASWLAWWPPRWSRTAPKTIAKLTMLAFQSGPFGMFFVIFPFLCFNGSILVHDAHRPFWYLTRGLILFWQVANSQKHTNGPWSAGTRWWKPTVHYNSTWQLFGRFNRHHKLILKWFIRFILALSPD